MWLVTFNGSVISLDAIAVLEVVNIYSGGKYSGSCVSATLHNQVIKRISEQYPDIDTAKISLRNIVDYFAVPKDEQPKVVFYNDWGKYKVITDG
jgi:hypothetical protein